MATSSRQTKAERQASAREKARQMQAQQLKAEKRRSLITRWSIVGAVVAVIAIIVVVVMMNASRSIPPTGPAPEVGTEAGGVVLSSDTEVAPGESVGEVDVDAVGDSTAEAGVQPESLDSAPPAEAGEPASIVIYADANCVHCAGFEQEYGAQLTEWLEAGDVTVEYRLVNFLDNPGTGNYSSRAANAAVCVAENSPEHYNDFLAGIFAAYDGSGISDKEIKEMATNLGADINSCVDGNTYRPFVNYTSAKALEAGVNGTPSVWVQGKNWAVDGGDQAFSEWAQAIIDEHNNA